MTSNRILLFHNLSSAIFGIRISEQSTLYSGSFSGHKVVIPSPWLLRGRRISLLAGGLSEILQSFPATPETSSEKHGYYFVKRFQVFDRDDIVGIKISW